MNDIDGTWLLRAAAYSAWLALVALIGAGVTIALFFGGAGAGWGPVNDVLSAIALLSLILPVLAVYRIGAPEAGAWLPVVTGAAIVGILVAATGQLLLVVGVISLQTSFVTGGIGILPVFAWVVALVVLALGTSALPPVVGWLAVGILALSVATAIASSVTTGPATWVVAVGLLIVLSGWLAALALLFGERATVA